MTMTASATEFIILLLVAGTPSSSGQAELCSCAPSRYTLTLDFNLSCPPVNIPTVDGIASTFCQVAPFGDEGVGEIDLIPVEVKRIDINELDTTFGVLSEQGIEGSFGDGDTFEFISFAADPNNTVNPPNVPKVLQVNLFGVNANNENIVNFFGIAFTNSCEQYPVLSEGQSVGWTRFSNLTAPLPDFCPLVEAGPVAGPVATAPSPMEPTEPPITEAPTVMTTPPQTDAIDPPETEAPAVATTPPPTTVASLTPDTDAPTIASCARSRYNFMWKII